MKHEICKVRDIPDVGTKLFPFFGREVHVWQTATGPRVAANTCPHLGGPLECKDAALVCPWHGARYDLADGRKTAGPGAPQARLMLLPTKIEGDALFYVWGEAA